MQNYPYGLFTPENYYLMQNMMRQNNFVYPGVGGYSPNFGYSGGVTAQAQTAPVQRLTVKEQIDLIDTKTKKALEELKQLETQVDVNIMGQAVPVEKEAFNKQTGYIATDGKDDGEIGFWNAAKNIGKGALNLFTNMFCDEKGAFSATQTANTAVVAAAIGAACWFVPFAAPVMLAFSGVTGLAELGKGIVRASNATTDEECERAFQNIGSGATQTILTAVGVKAMTKANNVKWYELHKVIQNGWKDFTTNSNPALNGSKWAAAKDYMANRWEAGKLALDKTYHSWTKGSHYEGKYESAIEYMTKQAESTTGNTQNRWNSIKDIYQKIYESTDEANYTRAGNKLNLFKTFVEKQITKLEANNGPADEIAALKDMLKYANSKTPQYAHQVMAKPQNAYEVIQKAIQNERGKLPQTGRTEVQRYQAKVLDKLENIYKTLYEAKTEAEQKAALKLLDKIRTITIDKAAKLAEGTPAEQRLAGEYFKIFERIKTGSDEVKSIINARTELIKNAQVIKDSKVASAQSKVKANQTLDHYKDLPEGGVKERWIVRQIKAPGRMLSSGKDNAKKVLGFGYRHIPEFVGIQSLHRGAEFLGMSEPQNIWLGAYGELLENTERTQLIQQYKNAIQQLNNMRYELSCGRSVDTSMLA